MPTLHRPTAARLAAALLGAGLLWSTAPSLDAQAAPVGTRVRVTAPAHMERPCVGTVVAAADELVVEERSGTIHRIPQQQIQTIEVSRGRARTQGALVGALAGGLAGGALFTAAAAGCPADNAFCPESDAAVFAGGAVIGAMAGASLGLLLAPERWDRAWQRTGRVGFALLRNRLAASVMLRTR